MKPGICRLCAVERLLVDSHVFPEFFYESVYDETGRYKSVSSHPRHRPRLMQKGLTEPLLCERCDGQLSKYESYAARLLRRADEICEAGVEGAEIPGVDLTTFRLFGLSLLWRAHVSSTHMFAQVDLGPHAEGIRQRLLLESPGEPHEYGFVLAKVTGLDTHGQTLVGPARSKYLGRRAYIFTARGYRWVFVVAGDSESLVSGMPFVGSTAALLIPAVHEDKRAFFATLRRAFPNALRKREPGPSQPVA